VSFSDVLMQHGQYPGEPAVPFTPGYDLRGRMDKIGPETSGIEPVEQIAVLTASGSYSKYICLQAHELIPLPAGINLDEAHDLRNEVKVEPEPVLLARKGSSP